MSSTVLRASSRRLAAFVFLATLSLVSCSSEGDPTRDTRLRPMTVGMRRLSSTGRWFVDEHGRKVLLRGVNSGGRSKMAPFVPFDFEPSAFDAANDTYFARVAALGANAVRLTLSWEGLEPTEGQYDLVYWARYRAMVDAAHAHGLGVIVDFHQDVYASPFCGDGFPLWTLGDLPHGPPHYDCSYVGWALAYFQPTSSVNQAFERFWTNADGIQTKLEAMWQFVATELATHPGVVGFEIMNEPGPGASDPAIFQQTTLPAFYARLGAIVQAAAGPSVIFGGLNAGDASAEHTFIPPDLGHFAFAPHYYDALAFLTVDAVEPDRLRTGLETTLALPGNPELPVLIGEYGMPEQTSKESYLDEIHTLFDERALSAMYWDAHVATELWNNENFTAFNPDGTEREWARALDRPFPRAIAGDDASFVFDRTAVHFELTVVGATEGVTEVYIPRRRFGSSPNVSVEGARWNFLPDAQVLVIAATPGDTYTVTVTR